ncbi:Acetyltransferase (GNAT) domain-containing protein [Devosia lucknowensis]|uniref:Acetyltransferase (GNAT) domain-containing protein n=1 Tax=Devosia lucknowensis TaxID=1096929 RepID=A0A1Y6GD25_9HYPH|nr:GNAT family N-acetyltransferase [Devosia lucknowensis]SMQ85979.1 Acetyltransferase (GNAT) domain-containing protein [Devosia lucknowensis]
MTFSIRRLGPGDIAAYRSIRHEALANHPEAFVSTAENFAQRSDADIRQMLETLTVFGAVMADGSLGGINAFLRNEGAKERHRGWMIQVYTRPEQRGTGLSRALVEHLVEHARHHVIQIHLGVWSENEPAIRLYRKLGFEHYATEPRYLFVNGRYIDEHLMVRFLDRDGSDSKA